MSKEEIIDRIKTDPAYAMAGLVSVYFKHKRNPIFSSYDSSVLTSIAEAVLNDRVVNDRQIGYVQRTIKKYAEHISVPRRRTTVKTVAPAKTPDSTEYMLADIDGEKVIIRFLFPRGDERFVECLRNVKTLYSRRWVPEERYWNAPLTIENVGSLKRWGFEFSEKLEEWYKAETTGDLVDIANLDFSFLNGDLYPYQADGVAFLESKRGRGLIGDEMGLGKTVQALAYLGLHPELRPATIVCPASLKLNWKKEIQTWLGNSEKVFIAQGRKFKSKPDNSTINIVNYDILPNRMRKVKRYGRTVKEEVPDSGWASHLESKVVIIDETHYIKNRKANRTKGTRLLCKDVQRVIGLSGTPITNRPVEFFTILNLLKPSVFPSFMKYTREYCDAKMGQYGWDFNGSSNIDKLHHLVTDTVMVRRKKADVLKELPPKQRTVIPVEITNRREYREAENDLIDWIYRTKGIDKARRAMMAEALVRFEELKQLSVAGKMDSAKEWIGDFIESGQKLVVFATHKSTLNVLEREFGNISVRIDGGVSLKNRNVAVERFQGDDSIRLFLGNLKAAGVGLTLTSASSTCFLEFGWTPGEHDQAEDRVHRISQLADSVNAWYLIAERTIETEIAGLLDRKRQVLSRVLDGEDAPDGSIFLELLDMYHRRTA